MGGVFPESNLVRDLKHQEALGLIGIGAALKIDP
jgi:hypothetical protein